MKTRAHLLGVSLTLAIAGSAQAQPTAKPAATSAPAPEPSAEPEPHAEAGTSTAKPVGRAPDPPVRASTSQWVFDLGYTNRQLTIKRVAPATVKVPRGTARMMGRFALELYVGRELLDRLRFNVPLTADPPDPTRRRRTFARPTFENVTTRLRLSMAHSPRAAWLAVVDRATGEEQRFWWPPNADGTLKPMAPAPPAPASAARSALTPAPSPAPSTSASAPAPATSAAASPAAGASAPPAAGASAAPVPPKPAPAP